MTDEDIARFQASLQHSESVWQQRMRSLHGGGSRESLEVTPEVWVVDEASMMGPRH